MNLARRKLLLAMGIFWTVVVLAVLINSSAYIGTARPWLFGNSISWYVGSRTWSALLFALGNFILAILMSQFLWSLGMAWKMPRAYFFFVTLLVVALAWLSVFPLGYFDSEAGESLISYLHKAGSRTMFFVMAVTVAFLMIRAKSKSLRIALAVFVGYAVFCAVAVLMGIGVFNAGLLLFESIYILTFMILVLWCGKEKLN